MRRPALTLVSLAVIVSPHASAASFGRDPYTPVTVRSVSSGTSMGSVAADGSGGMLIAWISNGDVYVQRLGASGAVAPGWPVNGFVACNAAGSQWSAVLLGDGAGGAIVAWTDPRGANQDVYATRILGNATIAPGWPVNGVDLSTNGVSSTKDDYAPQITSDGVGGAFVAWTLNYGTGDTDIYGAHVNSSGSVLWNFGLESPVGYQNLPKLIADGSGGFFAGFQDNDNGAHTHSKVARFDASGALLWGPKYIGTGSITSTYDQSPFDIASDGGSGVYAVVADAAFGTYWNITGNHFVSGGTNDPAWGSYKTLAFEANDSQGSPVVIPDGAGGFLLAFTDSRYGGPDLFALRIGPYGLPYSGWATGGVALAVAAGNQFPLAMVPDGTGGAVISILDDRLGADYFLYGIRVMGNGVIAPGWAYGGNPVDLGGLIDVASTQGMAADGSGGALFAWADKRGAPFGGYEGIYAQNMDRFGQYGDARPLVTRIADVPNDQGGEVSLQWSSSYLDSDPTRTVAQYSVWRRVPGGTAAQARARQTLALESAARANAEAAGRNSSPPTIRATVEGIQVVYWEYVASEPARQLAGYSKVVPTTSDSMAAGNPRTSLMVMAESAGAQMFWSSPADSGYSLDNIAPYAPAPFAGNYAAGATSLHWRAEAISDLGNYRVYRGTDASFVPSPSNLIATPTDTVYVDPGGQPYFYRLSAVDIHGNESPTTLLSPSNTTAVDATLPRELEFSAPEPNPAHESTVLHYALPRGANVRVAIYDAAGRRLRWLAAGSESAGDHALRWDLRDDSGRAVGAGLYFVRLDVEGRSFTRRVLAVHR